MLLFPEMQTVVSTELANSPKSLNFEMSNFAAILFLDFSRETISFKSEVDLPDSVETSSEG
jgi:hypothetical protein